MTIHAITEGPATSRDAEIRTLYAMIEALREQMELRDEAHRNAISHLEFKLNTEMPLRERLAVLEARAALQR